MDARSITRRLGGKRWRSERPAGVVGELLPPLAASRGRTSIYLPLLVLVAVLPGLYAVTQSWDLDPPSAWWGLRGLAVADGRWWDQYQPVRNVAGVQALKLYRQAALEPPLFAWIEGAFFRFSASRSPVLAVLPSWIAGAVLVVLIYSIAKRYYDASTAFLASALAASSPAVLSQVKLASPATLQASLAVSVLLVLDSWSRGERRLRRKAAAAGALMGLSFLAGGWFSLVVAPQWLLGEALNKQAHDSEEFPTNRPAWKLKSGALLLVVATLASAALCSTWFVSMHRLHGSEFLQALADRLCAEPGRRRRRLSIS